MGQDATTSRRTETVPVLENRELTRETWKIAFQAPEFAPLVRPGQFVMIRLPETVDPLLGRPFAVWSADKETGHVEVIYLVVGKMTKRLTRVKAGDQLEIWGPLGNGWEVIERATRKPDPSENGRNDDSAKSTGEPLPFRHLIMVAGGIGQTPFLSLAKKYAALPNPPVLSLLYGAKTKDRISLVDEFQKLGVRVRIATEDGSDGEKGFVTPMIPREIEAVGIPFAETLVAACGPKPMLRATWNEAAKRGVRCFTSLESPMSCGMGICFGCVVDYLTDDGIWDYRRTCVDGPVFDASRLKWD